MFLIGDNYIIVLPPKWYSSIVKWPSQIREGFFLWALVNYLLIFDKSLKQRAVSIRSFVLFVDKGGNYVSFEECFEDGGGIIATKY